MMTIKYLIISQSEFSLFTRIYQNSHFVIQNKNFHNLVPTNRHYVIYRQLLQGGVHGCVNDTNLIHVRMKTLPQNFISHMYTHTYTVCIGYTCDINSIVPLKCGGKHPSRTDE